MATENVTTKFKIDISEFKAGITEASKQIKLANAEFNAATAGMDDWSNSTDGISAKLKQLNSTLEAQKSKLAAYRGQLEAQEKAYAENGKRAEELKAKLKELADNGVSKTSDEYKQYKKSLTEVEKEMASNRTAADNLRVTILNQEAAVGAAERDIRNYNRQLTELQNESEDAAKASSDLDKSIDEAAESAEDAESKFDGLAGKIAKGLTVGIIALGAAAVATGKKLWDMAKDTAATGDEIDKQSQKLGVSAENYQKLSYAMERCGADVEDFRRGAVNISKTLDSVSKGADKAETAIGQLGVSMKKTDGSMRSTEDVLIDTIAALADMDDETKRNAAANEIFGRSYQELAPLLNSGADGIRELMQEAEDYGMVMSDEAVKASADFTDSMTRLNGTITGVKNRLAGQLLPSLGDLADGFSMLVNGVDGGSQLIERGIHGIAETVSTVLPAITGLIKSIVSELTKPENLTQLVDAGVTMVSALLSGIIEALPQLVDVAIGAAGQLLENVTGLQGFVDFIREQKDVIIAATAALIAYKAATAIASAVSTAVMAVKSLTSAFTGLNAVAAMNPIGAIAAAAAAAAVLIDSAMRNSSKSVMDATDDMKTALQGITTETQNVIDKQAGLDAIAEKYKYINTQIGNEEEKKRELAKLQEELNSLYGEEARKIDLVNGAYSEQIGLLGEMTDRELGITTRKVEKSLEDANKAVSEVIKKMSGESVDYIAALGEEAVNGPMEELARKYNRQMDEATGKMKGFLDLSAQGFVFNFTGEEDLEEVIQFYTELLDVMEHTSESGDGVADSLLPLFDDIYAYSKELEAAGANIDGLREKLVALQKQAEKTTALKSTAPSVRQGLPSYVTDMLNKTEATSEAAAEVVETAAETAEKTVTTAGASVKKTLTFATKAIGEYKNLGIVKQLGKALSEEQEEADKIASTVWQKSQETFNRSIKNNQLSVSEQVKGWQVIRDQFVEGSDQWIAANDKVIESQQKLAEENKKSAETMAKDTQAAFESMQNDIEKLQAETDKAVEALEKEMTDLQAAYDKAVSDRASQIASQYGLFDEVPERAEKSGTDLLRALTGQVDDIEQFYKKIDELSDRGVSEELVDSIRAMGVKASGELDAILGMTDEQLQKYDAKFAEKRELSTQIAEQELQPLKEETEGRIEEIKQEITDLQAETEQQINDIKLSYMAEVATAGTDFASTFISNMSGGIQSGAKELVTNVKDAVTAAWEQAFNGQELSSLLSLTPDTNGKSAIISAIQKALDGVLKTLNDILNRIRSVEISGFKPFEGLWDKNPLTLPKLARGGVLKRGEVGLLEGTGAEAVVPLENNAAWIGAVADDMRREMKTVNIGGGMTTNDNRTTFTQNIYAPTAPSRFELYRQTKNLLALMKEGVVNV